MHMHIHVFRTLLLLQLGTLEVRYTTDTHPLLARKPNYYRKLELFMENMASVCRQRNFSLVRMDPPVKPRTFGDSETANSK